MCFRGRDDKKGENNKNNRKSNAKMRSRNLILSCWCWEQKCWQQIFIFFSTRFIQKKKKNSLTLKNFPSTIYGMSSILCTYNKNEGEQMVGRMLIYFLKVSSHHRIELRIYPHFGLHKITIKFYSCWNVCSKCHIDINKIKMKEQREKKYLSLWLYLSWAFFAWHVYRLC